MEATVAREEPVPTAATVRGSRLGTLVIMAVTGAIILAVAYAVNQPSAGAGGLTNVTLTGTATGPAPIVDQPAPDFSATTVDGKAVRVSDFVGKPVWLTFGASWCQPCRAENPEIEAAAEKHAADGLVVLAIFISEDDAAVRDYADRVGLGYLKVSDPSTTIASQYRILGIPTHFFIDRAGVLRSMRIGSLDAPGMEGAIGAIIK